MGQIYLVASGKGGVGKTTVSANLASCLAKSGNRVLCIDADLNLKSLDILFNKQNEAVFDMQDLFMKNCDFDKAVLYHSSLPLLHFIAAPSRVEGDIVALYDYIKLLVSVKKYEYDFIFIDAPAGLFSVEHLMTKETVLLLVATPDATSMRSAEKAAMIAFDKGARSRLIVNKVRPDFIRKKLAPNIDEMIDGTSVRLLGVIPEDQKILKVAAKNSVLCLDKKSPARIAVENISARLCGAEIPLYNFK